MRLVFFLSVVWCIVLLKSQVQCTKSRKLWNDETERDITEQETDSALDVVQENAWPDESVKVGPVGGISVDQRGNVYIFHRGDREWNEKTFALNNTYSERQRGPILIPTILILNPITGTVIHKWGSGLFYMPHGITVDKNDNVWLTDVALHQVFKFPPLLNEKVNNPILTLGTAFLPGNTKSLFCKPTSVAVLSSGEFYVADGYCNSRILKYSPDGSLLMTFGRSTTLTADPVEYAFNIPHGMAIAEDKNLLCVVDRENGRVQCFNMNNGSFEFYIESPQIGRRIFDVSYSSVNGGLFYLINGPLQLQTHHLAGFIIRSDTLKIVAEFQPRNGFFMNPHAICVSRSGSSIYVGELRPFKVWKFRIDGMPAENYVPADRPTTKLSEPFNERHTADSNIGIDKPPGTIILAIIITAGILFFGIALVTAALVYARVRSRVCTCHCQNARWSRPSREGFKIKNLLGQQRDGFVKLNTNFDESEDDDGSETTALA